MLFADSLWDSGALYFMKAGGPFMWPILLLAVLGLAVVIERFRSLRLITTDTTALRAQSRGPVAAILAVGLHRFEQLRKLNYDPARIDEHVNKAMEDYGVHITA